MHTNGAEILNYICTKYNIDKYILKWDCIIFCCIFGLKQNDLDNEIDNTVIFSSRKISIVA